MAARLFVVLSATLRAVQCAAKYLGAIDRLVIRERPIGTAPRAFEVLRFDRSQKAKRRLPNAGAGPNSARAFGGGSLAAFMEHQQRAGKAAFAIAKRGDHRPFAR